MAKLVFDRNVNHNGSEYKKGTICPEALGVEMQKKGYAHPIPEPQAHVEAPKHDIKIDPPKSDAKK